MGLRSYESVANICRRIEDWNGASDPQYRGTGRLVFVRGCRTAKERAAVRSAWPNPHDPVRIEANTPSHPDDKKAAIACVKLCREIELIAR